MAKKEAPEKGTPEWWQDFEHKVHNDPGTSAYSPELIDPRVLKRILCELAAKEDLEPYHGEEKGTQEEIKYGT